MWVIEEWEEAHTLTHSLMKLCPSCEAANCAATQVLHSIIRNWKFITVFTRSLHWSLSCTRSIQSISSHPISLRSISILSTYQSLGLPSGLFPSGFPTNILYAFLKVHTCPRGKEMSFKTSRSCRDVRYGPEGSCFEGSSVISLVLEANVIPTHGHADFIVFKVTVTHICHQHAEAGNFQFPKIKIICFRSSLPMQTVSATNAAASSHDCTASILALLTTRCLKRRRWRELVNQCLQYWYTANVLSLRIQTQTNGYR
jgi:hypothetical protein